jgi:TolB-like protein
VRYLGGIDLRKRNDEPARAEEIRVTLAVLRPEADPDLIRFAEGVASDIINELGRYRDFHCVSRTSSFAADTRADAREVAGALRADYLLESSFHSVGDHIQIRVQLITGSTGLFVWSERLSCPAEPSGVARDEIVETLVPLVTGWHGAVHVAMHKSVARRDDDELNAFENYVKACDLDLVLDQPGLERSMRYLNRSLELDDRFARCWAMKSVMLRWAYPVYQSPAPDMLEDADNAIHRAYSLEPNDSANLSLISMTWAVNGDLERASAAIRQAVASAESDTDACIATTTPLALVLGDYDTARRMLDRAFPPNCPVAGYFRVVEARVSFFLGDYERAIAASRQGFSHVSSLAFRALSLIMLQEHDDARRAHRKLMQACPHFTFDRLEETLPILHHRARETYGHAKSRLFAVDHA